MHFIDEYAPLGFPRRMKKPLLQLLFAVRVYPICLPHSLALFNSKANVGFYKPMCLHVQTSFTFPKSLSPYCHSNMIQINPKVDNSN